MFGRLLNRGKRGIDTLKSSLPGTSTGEENPPSSSTTTVTSESRKVVSPVVDSAPIAEKGKGVSDGGRSPHVAVDRALPFLEDVDVSVGTSMVERYDAIVRSFGDHQMNTSNAALRASKGLQKTFQIIRQRIDEFERMQKALSELPLLAATMKSIEMSISKNLESISLLNGFIVHRRAERVRSEARMAIATLEKEHGKAQRAHEAGILSLRQQLVEEEEATKVAIAKKEALPALPPRVAAVPSAAMIPEEGKSILTPEKPRSYGTLG